MTRPITFPKTADDEWTNHETGVKIGRSRHQGLYVIAVPALNAVGMRLAKFAFPRLADARQEAARIVTGNRAEIAHAYDEAVIEDQDRTAPAEPATAVITIDSPQRIKGVAWLARYHRHAGARTAIRDLAVAVGVECRGGRIYPPRGWSGRLTTGWDRFIDRLSYNDRDIRWLAERMADHGKKTGASVTIGGPLAAEIRAYRTTTQARTAVAAAEMDRAHGVALAINRRRAREAAPEPDTAGSAPLCLRVDGPHFGHMTAHADAGCRDVPRTDAHGNPMTSWHIGGELTEPRPGDVVRFNRPGPPTVKWVVESFAADRNRVRLRMADDPSLADRFADWCDVDLVHRPLVMNAEEITRRAWFAMYTGPGTPVDYDSDTAEVLVRDEHGDETWHAVDRDAVDRLLTAMPNPAPAPAR